MRRLWYALIGRHPDGTKHVWVLAPLGTHWCEWDYCRCWRQRCTRCTKMKFISDGVLECR